MVATNVSVAACGLPAALPATSRTSARERGSGSMDKTLLISGKAASHLAWSPPMPGCGGRSICIRLATASGTTVGAGHLGSNPDVPSAAIESLLTPPVCARPRRDRQGRRSQGSRADEDVIELSPAAHRRSPSPFLRTPAEHGAPSHTRGDGALCCRSPRTTPRREPLVRSQQPTPAVVGSDLHRRSPGPRRRRRSLARGLEG